MSNPLIDLGEGSSQHVASKTSGLTIQLASTVLLRLPNGDVRSATIGKDSLIGLGKYGTFHSRDLIGQAYGMTYEILSDKSLKVLPPRSMQDIEDTDATNELINDGEFVQPLTIDEIEVLKQSGVHASDIIKRQIEQHANYSLKTEYSKEKYKKRKEAKYSKYFTTIEPTLFNVCEYWFNKDQHRLRDVRVDTLSQMLNMANIRPGGRYIAVDDASGIVVAGILERMGGTGRLITICDVDSPPAYPAMIQMNFTSDITSVLCSMNWASADEDYVPILVSAEPPTGHFQSERQKSRLNKRKAISESLMNTREELFGGDFEGLVVASEYDPFSIVEKLSPYLAGSASIVVQSPHIQILSDLQGRMRPIPSYLAPTLSEAWLRRYQVLPGRTHPLMTMSGSGGFILHATKVYDNPSASSVRAHRPPKVKKTKAETPFSGNTDNSADTTPVPEAQSDLDITEASEAGSALKGTVIQDSEMQDIMVERQ